jgi:hypothetical protein
MFELFLAFQLAAEPYRVVLEPDGGSPACDLAIHQGESGTPIARVEAYSPWRARATWFEDMVARPWRQATGQTDGRDAPGDEADDAVWLVGPGERPSLHVSVDFGSRTVGPSL